MGKKTAENLLLVEGVTDKAFIQALWKSTEKVQNFEIIACGNDEKVNRALKARLADSRPPPCIAIVKDADQNCEGRWQSIQRHLQQEGIVLHHKTRKNDGVILEATGDKPRIGVWIMPDNISEGMLEHFCSELAPQNVMTFAQQCVDEAKKNQYTSFKKNHRQKAVIHTYLAWQHEPGNGLDLAMTKKVLKSGHPLAQSFVTWLEKLFLTPNQSTE